VPPDRPVASDLKVRPAELAINLLVALFGPVAQPIGADDLGEVGRLRGGRRGGQIGQQIPSAVTGSRSGPVVAITSRCGPCGPQPPSAASASTRPRCGRRGSAAGCAATGRADQDSASPTHLRPRPGCGSLGRYAGALTGLERQDERYPGGIQRLDKAGAVAVEAVGHHRPEWDLGLLGGLDQLDRKLRLGPKLRIGLALGQPHRRRASRPAGWSTACQSSGLPSCRRRREN
jgi:hypothetical protein